VPISRGGPETSGSSRVSTKLRRFPVISGRLRRHGDQTRPGSPDDCWERRDKPGDRWLRHHAKPQGSALADGGV
jgi:hypothetical protein